MHYGNRPSSVCIVPDKDKPDVYLVPLSECENVDIETNRLSRTETMKKLPLATTKTAMKRYCNVHICKHDASGRAVRHPL